MQKTAAWLVRHALEQIGVRHTFGIPGVHNTEIYDELGASESITPVLVAHEAAARSWPTPSAAAARASGRW